MARYNNARGESVDGGSFVRGLIFLFIGAVTLMFSLVGIVFGTTIIFAAQSISDTNIMSEYKYPNACFSDNGTKLNQYNGEVACDNDANRQSSGYTTTYWGADVNSSLINSAYANWEDSNDKVAVGTQRIVTALTLALALIGLLFFILGIKNTGIWKSSNDGM